jgi:hypothetical protein
MKNSPRFLPLSAAAALLAAPMMTAEDPTGSIWSSNKVLFPGMTPTVNYDLSYPVRVTPDGPLDDAIMEVRVYGVALQSGSGRDLPVKATVTIGDSFEKEVFNGTASKVDRNEVLFERFVPGGTKVGLKAKGSSWSTRSSDGNHVVALTNGMSAPNYAPALNQGDIVSFLSNVYDSETKKVTIGDSDVIYLGELYSTRTGSSWYDMQDVVVHIHYRKVPEGYVAQN